MEKEENAIEIKRNPFVILWEEKEELFPKCVWILYGIVIALLIFIDVFVPIIKVNYEVILPEHFILLSISGIGVVSSMFMFGKEVYSKEIFAALLKYDSKVYYGYLADYIFALFLWALMLFVSVLKLILKFEVSLISVRIFSWIIVSIAMLSIIATISLVIKNMNRFSNSIAIQPDLVDTPEFEDFVE